MFPAAPAVGQSQGRQSIPVQQPRQQQQQSGLLKSSLDIVWSYSRSQAFYGSNIDCSPSFISRYRRPGDASDEDEEDGDEDDEDDGEDDSNVTQRDAGDEEQGVKGEVRRGRKSSTQRQRRTETRKGKGTSHGSSLANTEGTGEGGSASESQGDDDSRERRHAEIVPDLDSPTEDRFSSPDRRPPNARRRKDSSPAKARLRLQQKAELFKARQHDGVLPAFIPSGSSLGLSSAPGEDQADSRQGSAVNSSGTDGSSLNNGRLSPRSAGQARFNERTPLLEKRHKVGLHERAALEEDGALYGSSPPDTVPFPRRSPGMSLRKRSSGEAVIRKRRKSSGASKFLSPQGSSTFGQTLFNAINVLIGIGILALPLAFSQAGWILGIILLLFCSALTNYTAKILARALYDDPRLMTYADIGAKAFGAPARTFINILFCLEISALCVALIILLGDSLAIIFPLKPVYFKLIGFACIVPTLFLPLRYLSVASLIGIISVISLTLTVLIDGLVSHSQPGSLHNPMPTSIGPQWHKLPISFGLVMSGFGGHAVFPSLARDIRNPKYFNRVCDLAFLVATAFYLFMGTVGYLMFGNGVTDEVTRDMLHTPGLPRKLNLVAVAMVAVTPVCKYAISSTPLEGTISWMLGVEQEPAGVLLKRRTSSFKSSDISRSSYSTFSSAISDDLETPRPRNTELSNPSAISTVFSSMVQPLADIKPQQKAVARQVVKLVMSGVLLAIAIFIPSFDRIMGLLGAFSVFIICAIGPLSANLALHRKTMSKPAIFMNWVLIGISVAMGSVGTVYVFLPK